MLRARRGLYAVQVSGGSRVCLQIDRKWAVEKGNGTTGVVRRRRGEGRDGKPNGRKRYRKYERMYRADVDLGMQNGIPIAARESG